MSRIIKCPHCGKPAVSLAFIRDAAEHKAHVKEMKTTNAARAIRIDDAGFSNRVRRGLEDFAVWKAGRPDGSRSDDWREDYHYVTVPIHTLGELCLKTEYDLGRSPSRLGKVALAEIRAVLKAHGLWLGMTESDA